jgi:hypothetical protein
MREQTTALRTRSTGHTEEPSSSAATGWASWTWLVARGLGAVAVIVVGVIHLDQYKGAYGDVPTIGALFMVNFVAAIVIGVALLSPLEHVGRLGAVLVGLVALAGIGLAGGSFVMLLISEHSTLFGFHEAGFAPTAIARSRQFEIAAVVLLGIGLVARFATRSSQHRW